MFILLAFTYTLHSDIHIFYSILYSIIYPFISCNHPTCHITNSMLFNRLPYWFFFSPVPEAQSNDWSREPLHELVQHFALLDIHILYMFGSIARLRQWGGGGCLTCSNLFLPAFAVPRGMGGGGGSAPCDWRHYMQWFVDFRHSF